ncbi:hypothetical protein ACHAXR_005589 [Thalassiosira sp. AJA248-18]
MAACNLFGYGCSDEATIMIMAGLTKGLLKEIGIDDISNESIGLGLPSRATLVAIENSLAADVRSKDALEIVEDGANCFGAITDHGHRKGQDHLVKCATWAGYNENGKETIKVSCMDVDIGGHTAAEGGAAVRKSMLEFVDTVNIIKDAIDDDDDSAVEVDFEGDEADDTTVNTADTSDIADALDDTTDNVTTEHDMSVPQHAIDDAAENDTPEQYMSLPQRIIAEFTALTGDTGGGVAVGKLFQELIKNETIKSTSKKLGCDMHGIFKTLETACVDVFGSQPYSRGFAKSAAARD